MICEYCKKQMPIDGPPVCCQSARIDYADGYFREVGECPYCIRGDCEFCRLCKSMEDVYDPSEFNEPDCGPYYTPLEY